MAKSSRPKKITIHELLERSAEAALSLQRKDGSFPPSTNGVYKQLETPVRTTSHWLTVLSKSYELSEREIFKKAANKAANFLCSDKVRPHDYTFHSRNNPLKCDGLVGQAHPIRGLAFGSSALDRKDLCELAFDVFSLHPFNSDIGLWEKVEIDGKIFSFDRTMNHQLTFASAAAEMSNQYEKVRNKISTFLDHLAVNLHTHSDGVIKHYVRPPFRKIPLVFTDKPRHWRMIRNEAAFWYYSYTSNHKKKEIGYHPVNLRGIARLKQRFSEHCIWGTQVMKEISAYIDEFMKKNELYSNKYGSVTPGIQSAYADLILNPDSNSSTTNWIECDIRKRYDFNTNLYDKNSIDPALQSSAIYNLIYLPNILLDVE